MIPSRTAVSITVSRLALLSLLFALAVFSAQSFAAGAPGWIDPVGWG